MNWLRQHFFACADAFTHLLRSPGNFILNVLVVSIALALPFTGLTILENVRPVSEQLAVEPEISLFLKMDTPRDKAVALASSIRTILQDSNSTAKIEFTPREKAFDSLKSKTGLNDVLTTLGANPLPDSYVLKLSGFQNAMDASRVDDIASKLKALPGVDTVQIDSAWVKRLAALLRILRLVLLFLGITLGAVVVAVVFNTIRLQVMTQYDEIAVSRLLGATNAFIHRPFITPAHCSACAPAVWRWDWSCWHLQPAQCGHRRLRQPVCFRFRMAAPSLPATVFLLAVSALLGLFGAMLSVKRHLARLT